MCHEECNCDHPEISKGKPENCTLNQVIKCHGNQPIREVFKCKCHNDE